MNARALASVPIDVGPGANYTNRSVPIATWWGAAVAGSYDVQTVSAAGRGSVVARFHALARKWQEETQNVSVLADIILHPSYQEIIGMGPAAIPMLLDELEREPNHWFPALLAISGAQNPVSDSDAGDIGKMTEAWLEWAKENSYR
jgi:hypothetical protein